KRKYVNVYRKRGQVTGKIFSYGRDLVEVKRTRDTKDLVTALIGIGKDEGDGSILTFQDYTPPDNFKYEKNEDWVGSIESLQRWRRNDKHIFGVYKDESATNPAELYQNTVKELDKRSRPKVTYQMSVLLLERLIGQQCRLGDEIIVKDHSFTPELAIRGRVTEKKSSKTSVDPQQNQVILGDV
ncbi:phage minor structural protein, N-terminal region, partial [Thermoactinomyces sp. DSM 45891]|uniref:phage tail spike protein n=1 Tax=Thermoactinomyces sp. DSM 45891 TaxID=1761907 RepID=UPI000912F71D